MKISPRIVFMGTPEFAVPSLEKLVEAGYPVVGVVTATDKMGGRGGKQLLESPVKVAAQRLGIPVLQPKNLKDPGFQNELRALNADLQIVVAFRMLPEAVWDMPELGTFNLHGSLLPKYRGAAPINWAVIQGELETGATTFFIRHEIDTGDILQQLRIPIGENDTAGDVHDRMMHDGANLVVDTVRQIEAGDYELRKQDDTAATPAPKLNREMARIDFDRPVREVHNFVRGLSPWPAAWTLLGGEQLKVIRTRVEAARTEGAPGTVVTDGKTQLKVACQDGYLYIHELQLAGRKRMAVEEFLRGVDVAEGTVLG
ncbi:methionyl-tRNA formyltransferase [Neolewinella xylanilytica]|uniref:Methionyl-tRNA formyltransferase n=1 Tax=Neolewinella xylanilytica TaxID=1514080 RepID=A0A2S6I5N5_9BACT|nr:methionyl-tRNA formyltransferase [Neolewinella xylanilytica]PPK86478.1 methionyl-tRNA formyltransferase [Neolewinella xylanilytica]